MRRILITKQMDKWAEEYADALNEVHGNYITPDKGLDVLYNNIPEAYYEHRKYVKSIKDMHKTIVTLHPSEFEDWYDKLNYWNTKKDCESAMKLKIKELGDEEFYKYVIDAMRYDYAQKFLMPGYIDKMQIKACVYCNAQYAVTTDHLILYDKDDCFKGYGRRYAHYELDHFKAKSYYPFLCTSFFNLLPSCGSCNKHKSDDESLFCLYTDNPNELDVMQFMLTPESVLQYQKSFDCKDLMIHLRPIDKEDDVVNNHQRRFHIDEVYNHHRDVAGEAVCHHMMHNSAYVQHLKDAFANLFTEDTTPDIDLLFWGHHLDPKDTHKRPLNKLVSDLSKTL